MSVKLIVECQLPKALMLDEFERISEEDEEYKEIKNAVIRR